MPSTTSPPCLLFLIGMPAAGKTFWGEKVAEGYGLRFIDLDDYTSHQEQISIPEIFKRHGEPGFREREAKYLRQLIGSLVSDTVIACGGGTPCYNSNLQRMKDAGAVVYLRAGITRLTSNLRQCADIRPMLQDKTDLASYLLELLDKRKNIYEQAEYIVDVENLTLATFDKIIASCTNRH